MARRNTRLRDGDDLDEISSNCVTRCLCCWALSDWDVPSCSERKAEEILRGWGKP
jgi:hypothetical protein